MSPCKCLCILHAYWWWPDNVDCPKPTSASLYTEKWSIQTISCPERTPKDGTQQSYTDSDLQFHSRSEASELLLYVLHPLLQRLLLLRFLQHLVAQLVNINSCPGKQPQGLKQDQVLSVNAASLAFNVCRTLNTVRLRDFLLNGPGPGHMWAVGQENGKAGKHALISQHVTTTCFSSLVFSDAEKTPLPLKIFVLFSASLPTEFYSLTRTEHRVLRSLEFVTVSGRNLERETFCLESTRLQQG